MKITEGQGIKTTKGRRLDVPSLADYLRQRLPGTETWLSGNLWVDDDRRRPIRWEGTSVIFIDVDFHDEEDKHSTPPDASRKLLELADIPCSLWHHTPRGARFAFELSALCKDSDVQRDATVGAAQLIAEALDQNAIDGYRPDEKTYDLARLMYAPNAVVGGVQRSSPIFEYMGVGFVFEVADLVAETKASVRIPDVDVSSILAKMPREGSGDGSLPLIKVAAKACHLGVDSPELFIELAQCWNQKRQEPWSDEDLKTRYEDARRKYLREGKVRIPVNDKGQPIYSVAVVDRILREDRRYKGGLSYNGLNLTVYLKDQPLHPDTGAHRVRIDITERYGFGSKVAQVDVDRCLLDIARERTFHPVADYLSQLVWDKVPRVLNLGEKILRTDHPAAQVYLKRWMISAVARAMDPGCKVDTMLILCGPQGVGKSTFFAKLVADPTWFADSPLDLGNKDAYLQILGTWIYEFSELDGLYTKADVTRIRNFQSSSADTFRAPYARGTERHPRGCVFGGTTNASDVIRDEDGSRRSWVLRVDNPVDIGRLESLRDQLWAEALEMYQKGEQWWLTDAEEVMRQECNALFMPDQPEVDTAVSNIEELLKRSDVITIQGVEVHALTGKIVAERLGYPGMLASPAIMRRITRAFKQLGFEPKVVAGKTGSRKTERYWIRPITEAPAEGAPKGFH